MPSKKSSNSQSSTTHSMSSSLLNNIDIRIYIGILYNLLIILYLINLENEACNCVMDWRHNYLKYFSSTLIILGIIGLFTNIRNSEIGFLIKLLLCIGSIVNVYSLFTYIGDLDATNCSCARDKQRTMHYFLYSWRWVLVLSLVMGILCILVGTCVHKH